MLSYILAGLALGSIYAIAAGSLVITYVASGVFNLAFAAMAFTVARVFYLLNTEQDWSILPAAVVSLLLFAPLLGVVLYLLLFRFLRGRSMVIKLMTTLGLSVAMPALVDVLLGSLTSTAATGLAPRPLKVFHPFGAVVNLDQVFTYAGLAIVLLAGVVLLRFTDIGLKVRALVDSEALTSLSGTNPHTISMGVWAASTTLAGLTGILIAPTAGLSLGGMTNMMAAAFAAVIAARLHSLPVAVGVALAMGVVTNVIQKFMAPDSSFVSAIVPSVPFAFMLLALLYYAVRGQAGDTTAGGALDRAIGTQGGDPDTAPARTINIGRIPLPAIISGIFLVLVVAIPLGLDDYWSGLAAGGIALGIALLSYTLVTGEGGMLWLCQITFAGLGAVLAAELSTNHGWSPLIAVIVGPAALVPVGILLGILTIRLGNLYVALVTLTFGLLIQTLVLTQDPYYNYGSGTAMSRPGFAQDNASFAFLALAVFLILGVLVLNLRRSTAGMTLSAVRWSEDGARTIGISVLQSKVLVSALATYVAAVGGGFLAMNYQSTLPDSFGPFAGLVWLAVLVTIGARSIMAALAAGLAYSMLPGVFASYLPTEVSSLPVVLFGLGAVLLAKNPEGAVAQNGAAIARLIERSRARRAAASSPDDSPGGPPGPETKILQDAVVGEQA